MAFPYRYYNLSAEAFRQLYSARITTHEYTRRSQFTGPPQRAGNAPSLVVMAVSASSHRQAV